MVFLLFTELLRQRMMDTDEDEENEDENDMEGNYYMEY